MKKEESISSTALEWMIQADYDMKSAQVLLENKRYVHAVFMCHLALEKALKGLHAAKFSDLPPRTHNLVFIVEKLHLNLPDEMYDYLSVLSGVSVPMRYPDELTKIKKSYSRSRAEGMIKEGKEVLRWLKRQLKKS